MDFTLRQAAAADRAIAARVAQLRHELRVDARIAIHADVVTERARQRDRVLACLARIDALERIRFELRRRIGDANAERGVAARLAEAKRLELLEARLKALAHAAPGRGDEELTALADALRRRLAERDGPMESDLAIETGLFSRAEIDGFDARMLDARRRLAALRDEILRLNAAATVALDDANAAILEQEGMV